MNPPKEDEKPRIATNAEWTERRQADPDSPEFAYPEIEYQPGWSFRWTESNGLTFLWIGVETAPKKTCARTGLPRVAPTFCELPWMPFRNEWLVEQIEEIEAHEREEWLLVNGVRVRDPHEGDTP